MVGWCSMGTFNDPCCKHVDLTINHWEFTCSHLIEISLVNIVNQALKKRTLMSIPIFWPFGLFTRRMWAGGHQSFDPFQSFCQWRTRGTEATSSGIFPTFGSCGYSVKGYGLLEFLSIRWPPRIPRCFFWYVKIAYIRLLWSSLKSKSKDEQKVGLWSDSHKQSEATKTNIRRAPAWRRKICELGAVHSWGCSRSEAFLCICRGGVGTRWCPIVS